MVLAPTAPAEQDKNTEDLQGALCAPIAITSSMPSALHRQCQANVRCGNKSLVPATRLTCASACENARSSCGEMSCISPRSAHACSHKGPVDSELCRSSRTCTSHIYQCFYMQQPARCGTLAAPRHPLPSSSAAVHHNTDQEPTHLDNPPSRAAAWRRGTSHDPGHALEPGCGAAPSTYTAARTILSRLHRCTCTCLIRISCLVAAQVVGRPQAHSPVDCLNSGEKGGVQGGVHATDVHHPRTDPPPEDCRLPTLLTARRHGRCGGGPPQAALRHAQLPPVELEAQVSYVRE